MKTVKTVLAVLLSVLLLTLGSTALAANEAKIETLDNSAIDNTMWMIAGGEDELYIYPRPDDAKDRFDIFTAEITSSDESVLGVGPGKRDTYEYGYVILTGRRAGSAVVTVTDPGSGAACSVKVTVLPQYLQSVMSLLVALQTILANIRIALTSIFGG
ncbi:MAG: hypothetical protein IJK23_13070 [Clostridia bacterium]|nr:hypothetical protein [Clostridia bacterium]